MNERRLTLLPDERFVLSLAALQERLESIGRNITAENFSSILDDTMRRVLSLSFSDVGAHEGTVWLVDEGTKTLVPAYNTGPNAGKLVGHFKQSLSSGLVSMVFASERAFAENEVFRNSKQDKSLDALLELRTYAMIAVPFYFLEACRGVVSCVQLKDLNPIAPDPPGFGEGHQAIVRHAADTLGRLIEYRILRVTVGLR